MKYLLILVAVAMLTSCIGEKETRLVFANNEHLHDKKRRKIKDDMINDLMSFIAPHLRGYIPSNEMLKRTVNIVEKIMNKSEIIFDDGINTKGKALRNSRRLFKSSVIKLKRESIIKL